LTFLFIYEIVEIIKLFLKSKKEGGKMKTATLTSEKNDGLKEFKDRQKFDKKFQRYGVIICLAIIFLIPLLVLIF